MSSGFDPKSPNVARVYGTLIGGKDSYESDRGAASELAAISPQIAAIAAENKQFATRAVDWLASQGITQFVDLGCGMPAAPNTHETVHEARPDARVAYVDIDPIVVSHMGTFARPGSGVTAVQADAGDPAAALAALKGAIDFTRPVALLMFALLHFWEGSAAAELVTGYTSGLASGSYLALSVIGSEGKVMDRLVPAYSAAIAPMYPYSAAEAARLLGSFELVPPGVTAQNVWRPGWAEAPAGPDRDFGGHVAVAHVGGHAEH